MRAQRVAAAEDPPAENVRGLRFGLTPVTPSVRAAVLEALRRHLQTQLGTSLLLSPRVSYRETMDQIKYRQLDFAWVSPMPYVYLERRHFAQLVATPVYHGGVTSRACLIVGVSDTTTRSIADLAGRVFAYSDPFSLSGRLLPQMALRAAGHDPARFFRKSFFAASPQNVIEAVAVGLADGGSVDSYIWESMLLSRPGLSTQIRVVHTSEPFGFAPIVASRSASDAEIRSMQQALTQLDTSQAGADVLRALNLDGFKVADPSIYQSAAAMLRQAGEA